MSADGHTYQLTLHSPEDVRAARQLTGKIAAELGFGGITSLIELLASEVLTNVHRHCVRKECELRLKVLGRRTLRVEVTDQSLDLPRRRQPAPDEVGGRGLAVLDFAVCWGTVVHPAACRKVVFFECAEQPP